MKNKDKIVAASAATSGVSSRTFPRIAKIFDQLIKPMNALEKRMNATTSKDYRRVARKFGREAAKILTDYDPNVETNGVSAEQLRNGDFEVHHQFPVSDAEMDESKMRTTKNMALVDREDHDRIHHGDTPDKTESAMDATKRIGRRDRFRQSMVSFLDMVLSAFYVGFSSEFLYGIIYKKVILKEKTDKAFWKENALFSLKTGLTLFVFALPIWLVVMICQVCGLSERAVNFVQLGFSVVLLLFGLLTSTLWHYKASNDAKSALIDLGANSIKAISMMALLSLCEFFVEGYLVDALPQLYITVKYFLMNSITVVIVIGIRFLSDSLELFLAKRKANAKSSS